MVYTTLYIYPNGMDGWYSCQCIATAKLNALYLHARYLYVRGYLVQPYVKVISVSYSSSKHLDRIRKTYRKSNQLKIKRKVHFDCFLASSDAYRVDIFIESYWGKKTPTPKQCKILQSTVNGRWNNIILSTVLLLLTVQNYSHQKPAKVNSMQHLHKRQKSSKK